MIAPPLRFESVYLAPRPGDPGWATTRTRPNVRAFARIGRCRFEFVRLDAGARVEVYDYPRSWGGVARFVGYAGPLTSDKLVALAHVAVAHLPIGERFGREHQIGGAS